jgi:hypothetical protein
MASPARCDDLCCCCCCSGVAAAAAAAFLAVLQHRSSSPATADFGLVAPEHFRRRWTSFILRGLRMKSSAPAVKHLLILWGSFSDDMTTTGIGFGDPNA